MLRDRSDDMMADVLAQMSVISEQRAHAYDGVQVHGGEKNRAPAPLADKPMVDYWRDRYNNTRSAAVRQTVVREAMEALELARRMPIPRGQEPEYGSAQWKRYIAESSETGGELARKFNVSREYIRQIRAKYGKDAA